jgi:hypothetical protein
VARRDNIFDSHAPLTGVFLALNIALYLYAAAASGNLSIHADISSRWGAISRRPSGRANGTG